jgi:ankyrin repeat protein
VWKGQEVVVWLLIEKGADVSVTDHNKSTPLYFATQGGHMLVTQLLIEKGAGGSTAHRERSETIHRVSRLAEDFECGLKLVSISRSPNKLL